MISETITSKRCMPKRCTGPTPIALIVIFTLTISARGEVGAPPSSGRETGAAVVATDPEEAIMEIELNDFNVVMSAVMPAGRLTLRLANRGFQEHNLFFVVVESDSTVWEIERRLSPGERRIVTLDLEAGTYWAVCDVSGHEDKGMAWEFVVEETAPSESGS